MHLNVCLLSLMIFKIMLMTRMLALMKVYFSLLYVEWRKWMPKNVIECWLKCKNRYWIWLLANVRFFALMNVSLRCWSPFHANECVFSRNEQQKVYLVDLIIIFFTEWFQIQKEFTTPCEETSPQELNKRLQKFYLLPRKSDDRGRSVIAHQNCNRWQQ